MPIGAFLGWVVGVALAFLIGMFALFAFGMPVAAIIGALSGTPLGFLAPVLTAITGLFPVLAGPIAALMASLAGIWVILLAIIAVFVAYLPVFLLAYVIASAALAPSLPTTAFPLAAGTTFGTAMPVTIPPSLGESFARGLMAGFNAGINFLLILLLVPFDPVWAQIVAAYAFVVITLVLVVPVATNRVYQGFLGWSAWLFPVSYVATFIGLLLFVFNTIASRLAGSPGGTVFGVRVDFTTGVIESSDGFILNLSGFAGGFSLGNFTFLMNVALPAPVFTAASVSSHETGHSLNTAAFGGVILWINAIDENIAPFRKANLAYGELMAEGHSVAMPGPSNSDFSVMLWY